MNKIHTTSRIYNSYNIAKVFKNSLENFDIPENQKVDLLYFTVTQLILNKSFSEALTLINQDNNNNQTILKSFLKADALFNLGLKEKNENYKKESLRILEIIINDYVLLKLNKPSFKLALAPVFYLTGKVYADFGQNDLAAEAYLNCLEMKEEMSETASNTISDFFKKNKNVKSKKPHIMAINPVKLNCSQSDLFELEEKAIESLNLMKNQNK